jgi:hypothetical protein
MYYGSEFVSKAMEACAYQYCVDLDFIRPGWPVENAYIESFNGRLRDECLNVQVFFAPADVRDKLEQWRHDYNRVRPHSALNDHAPNDFAERWIARSTAAAGTAGPPVVSGAVHDAPALDPKPLQLFGPPSADAKGGPETLLNEDQTSALLEVVT